MNTGYTMHCEKGVLVYCGNKPDFEACCIWMQSWYPTAAHMPGTYRATALLWKPFENGTFFFLRSVLSISSVLHLHIPEKS